MMIFCKSLASFCLLHVLALIGIGAEPPLFEKNRPDWEIKFKDVDNAVLSVMPGESEKTFFEPIKKKTIKWEQDVFCPAFTVLDGKLQCVYRAFGDDEEWRLGWASSNDVRHFMRSEEPILYAKPDEPILDVLGDMKQKGVSFGDPHIAADREGNFYLYFNFLHFGNTTNDQQLAVATSRDLKKWDLRGRVFANEATVDRQVIPERSPWRLLCATVVSQLDGDRFVAAKIGGKYWMYFNCYATKGSYCLCMATSEDLIRWKVLRDGQGKLVTLLPPRSGMFDSWYTDPVAAVLRTDGILLIYNGINAEPEKGGNKRLKYYAHYPAQALFDKDDPSRLLRRGSSPFKGGDEELEGRPIVFWVAPVYEAWSLVPYKGELLLYWNHTFGRRSVGLWKAPIPDNMVGKQDGVTNGADSSSQAITEEFDDYKPWYEPGTFVPVDEKDATDVLAVSIHVEGLIHQQFKFGYRKLTKREQISSGGRATSSYGDGPNSYCGLSVNEVSGGPITGDKIQLTVRYYGKNTAGKKFKGTESIEVPVGKDANGKAGELTYKAEWKEIYPDGRPVAWFRLDAQDQGVVLKHGDGPGECDVRGAREALVFKVDGKYYLHYDGAGAKGWLACLATSDDLVHWTKKGPVLDFGKPGEDDSAAACSPWVYFDSRTWHMYYLGTPNVTPAPDYIPSFPYLTLKAKSQSPAGPWIKQKDVVPFRTKPGTYYSDTASPGEVIKLGDEYLMFFSASMKRTIGIARTKDLDGPWAIDPKPIVPPEEQIENTSFYFEPANKTWFMFTNHIGIDKGLEYTDAVWVYWTKDLNRWNAADKAVVLDGKNCTWSKKCIGMPSVVKVGERLAILYDAPGGESISHMQRDIGLAWLPLPLVPPNRK